MPNGDSSSDCVSYVVPAFSMSLHVPTPCTASPTSRVLVTPLPSLVPPISDVSDSLLFFTKLSCLLGCVCPFSSSNVSVAAAAKSLQLCPTLCDPIDGIPSGSSVPEILQARTLEWVAISFSNA